MIKKMIRKIQPATNQQKVALWLKKLERNYTYITRHTGITNAVLSRFKHGKPVALEVIAKLAEFTGLELKAPLKGCRTELVFNRK